MWKKLPLFVFLIIVVTLTGGCGSPTPGPTPTRTPTVLPTSTPLPTPTETPSPTPSPTVVVEAEATPFPPDVNPLTGLKVDDPEMLEHSPLAIKISNSPEVRPQSGLNAADLIFEHFAEGGITRFTAIYYSTYPERVGSVRSGRLIDLELPAMYKAVFAFSGMSGGVKERLRESDLFPTQVASPDFGVGQPYFYRVPEEGKAFEHTLYADPESLRSLAAERGFDQRPEYPRHMAFSETVPEDSVVDEVSYLEINYLVNVCTAEWTYDEETGRWLRRTAGTIQTDYLTGEQINMANVVVAYAHHVESDIWEQMIGDQSQWIRSIEIQVWGSGPALIFRDGKMIQGYWQREARDHMLTFVDGSGNPVPLKPGNTWFQMVPLETTSEEFEEGKLRFLPVR